MDMQKVVIEGEVVYSTDPTELSVERIEIILDRITRREEWLAEERNRLIRELLSRSMNCNG